jgi:hypothetical protein
MTPVTGGVNLKKKLCRRVFAKPAGIAERIRLAA